MDGLPFARVGCRCVAEKCLVIVCRRDRRVGQFEPSPNGHRRDCGGGAQRTLPNRGLVSSPCDLLPCRLVGIQVRHENHLVIVGAGGRERDSAFGVERRQCRRAVGAKHLEVGVGNHAHRLSGILNIGVDAWLATLPRLPRQFVAAGQPIEPGHSVIASQFQRHAVKLDFRCAVAVFLAKHQISSRPVRLHISYSHFVSILSG